jgi:protein-S-isoprenylcysteine O-methyltransferase Ste14
MNTSTRAGVVMRIPPPLLYVVSFFVGLGMQRLAPLTYGSASLAKAAWYAGLGLIGTGLLIVLSSVGMFLLTRTTIIPFGTAAHLVSNGPFRFTRNPMYLGLALIYVGVAGILSEPWPLVFLPLPLLVMDRIVIPFEEARLQAVFGAAFQQYCGKVRRWI